MGIFLEWSVVKGFGDVKRDNGEKFGFGNENVGVI